MTPQTLEKLLSTDRVFRQHLQRAVAASRVPANPQLNLRDLSRLVEAVSPRDSILVIRRLDRLKGDMQALQQALAVDPREVILWPAPPRGASDTHKPPGMAFLTCLRGPTASREILERCKGMVTVHKADGVPVNITVQGYEYRTNDKSKRTEVPDVSAPHYMSRTCVVITEGWRAAEVVVGSP